MLGSFFLKKSSIFLLPSQVSKLYKVIAQLQTFQRPGKFCSQAQSAAVPEVLLRSGLAPGAGSELLLAVGPSAP